MIAEQQTTHKVNLANYNNSWYNTGAGPFKRLAWYFVNVFFFQNPLNPSSALKVLLLRLFGAKVGKGVVVKPAVNIKYPWLLRVGDFVWIGEKVWIDSLVAVTIENNVTVSQGAMLLTGSHDYTSTSFELVVKEIILEQGAWVGAKAIVCPGVVCGSHSVLAAGSVATKSLQPYTIYQGNPAIPKRHRNLEA
ncbi:WcaF family extracellular polysaccharide biosynthesis acetyltransferase [Pontibacter sp. MBLB2868]|uniref:WcaF family extracellular polysaccharide biosynthesis acetyltransferase n=1 Tax=Pontibacter sp. MBLB2868 TaxID=3451555 RepID=UPI003F753E6A